MASRLLNDLDSRFRPLAVELIARLAEIQIPVMIINTLRTAEEQQQNLAKQVSWTLNSKHLPQPPDGKSLAIDLCPYAIFQLHGASKLKWDASDPAWVRMGDIGESLGLRWGGRWKPNRDLGHFEWMAPKGTLV